MVFNSIQIDPVECTIRLCLFEGGNLALGLVPFPFAKEFDTAVKSLQADFLRFVHGFNGPEWFIDHDRLASSSKLDIVQLAKCEGWRCIVRILTHDDIDTVEFR